MYSVENIVLYSASSAIFFALHTFCKIEYTVSDAVIFTVVFLRNRPFSGILAFTLSDNESQYFRKLSQRIVIVQVSAAGFAVAFCAADGFFVAFGTDDDRFVLVDGFPVAFRAFNGFVVLFTDGFCFAEGCGEAVLSVPGVRCGDFFTVLGFVVCFPGSDVDVLPGASDAPTSSGGSVSDTVPLSVCVLSGVTNRSFANCFCSCLY